MGSSIAAATEPAFARLTRHGMPRQHAFEALEQLRVLEAGHRIAVGLTPVPFPPGVDTEADLARAEARFLSET